MDFDGERGHYGAWRPLCGAGRPDQRGPGGHCAFLGRYAGFGLLGWLLAGFVLLARPAERAGVHVVYRFRVPAGTDAEWLTSLRVWAEHRCWVRPGRLDWYVRDDLQLKAFAAGRRSIAVTTGFLQLLQTGRIRHDEAVAVAIHEIGHHVTGATRYGLLAQWLCWPWRVTYRVMMRLGGAMPYAEAGTVLTPVIFVIAIVRTAQLDAPPEQLVPVLSLLATLALGIFVAPALGAVFARASERAADRYTTQQGAGADLAAAPHQVVPDLR